MAATTITDKSLLEPVLAGYVKAAIPQKFSLLASGVLTIDDNPPFGFENGLGGNIYDVRGRYQDTGAWDTPVADTDPTVNSITTYTHKSIVVRRGKFYGNEDFASIAVGEGTDEWMQDAAAIMAGNQAINLEKHFFQTFLLGLYNDTNGVLNSTHCVNAQGLGFTYPLFGEANRLLGEGGGNLDTCFMHSEVYWKSQVNLMISAEPTWDAINAYKEAGVTFMGMLGSTRIFLNDRTYNTGGVYDTILLGKGALGLAWQYKDAVEIFPRQLKAMGTNVMAYKLAFSPSMNKVSFTGTAPTGIGGATDANITTGTNWTALTAVASEIPCVVIKSLAATV